MRLPMLSSRLRRLGRFLGLARARVRASRPAFRRRARRFRGQADGRAATRTIAEVHILAIEPVLPADAVHSIGRVHCATGTANGLHARTLRPLLFQRLVLIARRIAEAARFPYIHRARSILRDRRAKTVEGLRMELRYTRFANAQNSPDLPQREFLLVIKFEHPQ